MDIPETHYVRSGEIAIAYQVHGSGEHDIVVAGGSASNIETAWRMPGMMRLHERLGRFARVIAYDRRDSGVSDPIKDDLTLEAHAADALAVIDAVGADRPVLIGSLDGARSHAVLAATRPEIPRGIVALVPTARGAASSSPELAQSAARGIAKVEDYPNALLPLWAPQWAADPLLRDQLARFVRTAASPRQAERLLRMSLTSDITDVLPLVQAPMLALYPRDLALVPAEAVLEFVELAPNAVFREIPGDSAITFALDVDLLADVIEEFVTGTAPAPPTNRVLATVLFTDLVGSTERAAQAGDRAWAGTLDRHLAATRAAVTAHGGQTIKTTGDGVLATFTGPAQGVRCAGKIIADARGLGLDLRSGLHTGEVERTGDDVAGLAVHLAARIMALSGAGEILVSRTVRDLVIGSELTFEDRGEHELKGIPDRWAVYAAA